LQNSGFVDFRDYFGRFFAFFKGSNIRKLILLPLKKAKSGQNNPENRRTLSFATTSVKRRLFIKSCQKISAQSQKAWASMLRRISDFRDWLVELNNVALDAARRSITVSLRMVRKIYVEKRELVVISHRRFLKQCVATGTLVMTSYGRLLGQCRRLFVSMRRLTRFISEKIHWAFATTEKLIAAFFIKRVKAVRRTILRSKRRGIEKCCKAWTATSEGISNFRENVVKQHQKSLGVSRWLICAIRKNSSELCQRVLNFFQWIFDQCRKGFSFTRKLFISLKNSVKRAQIASKLRTYSLSKKQSARKAGRAFNDEKLRAVLRPSLGRRAMFALKQPIKESAIWIRQIPRKVLRLKKISVKHTPTIYKEISKLQDYRIIFSKQKKIIASKWKAKRLPNPLKNLNLSSVSTVSFWMIVGYLFLGRHKTAPFNGSNSSNGSGSTETILADAGFPLLGAIGPPVNNQKEDTSSRFSFWPKRMTLRHVEGSGEGIGYGTDYTTLALLFASDYKVGHIMPMLDLRAHRFDNNTYAANVGIAGRYIPQSGTFCQILGFNAFYDYREGNKGNYSQVGVGLEILGKRWDLRANGYAPIGVKKHKTTCVFDDYIGDYYAIHRECEFTSYGYNAEIGYYLVRSKDYFLYAAGGPYYLARKCHDKTRGGMFRIRPQYKDYLALDFSVSYDPVFKTVYQAQVILYLPLYQLSKKGNQRPCNLLDQQIYQPIERFEVMPLGRRSCWQTNF
jgi:hypothetical protein